MDFGDLWTHAWLCSCRLARQHHRRYLKVSLLSVGLSLLALGLLHPPLLVPDLLLDSLFLVADLRKVRHVNLTLAQRSYVRAGCLFADIDIAQAT